jgi:hypothetical protein
MLEDRRPLAEAFRDPGHGNLATERLGSPLGHGIQPRRPAVSSTRIPARARSACPETTALKRSSITALLATMSATWPGVSGFVAGNHGVHFQF